MNRTTSSRLIRQAEKSIPGGVNSPVRAFKGVGGDPVFFTRGEGPYLYDVDDNRYVDYIQSWGPMILGHNHRPTVDAVVQQAQRALGFGAPTEGEITLAEKIIDMVPSIEKVRLVNSGTEATMSAIRLARGFTGRDLILKFTGCYHGHSDSLLVKAGSGVLTLGIPNSPGVPDAIAARTLNAPYNDLEAVRTIFSEYPEQIACIIIEPVAGNMGCIPPVPGFLEGLRQLTKDQGTVLIFDEVMTGFRSKFGGAQELLGVEADITCLGKVIGGGFPVGAYGARNEIMEQVAPLGGMYQAGTLSGNPIAMAGGISTLKELKKQNPYEKFDAVGDRLSSMLLGAGKKYNIDVTVNRFGSMMNPFFTNVHVTNFEQAQTSNTNRFAIFFWEMIKNGVFLPPSQFEAWFLSSAISEKDMLVIEKAIDKSFQKIQEEQ